MPRYRIWTVGGLSPGVGPVQGALLYMLIRKEGEIHRLASYAMIGGGLSAGLKGGVSIALGPQSSSDFDSPVQDADLFWGTVSTLENGIQLGVVNAGYSDMIWLTGPAAGTRCSSESHGVCLGASVTWGSSTLVMFKFLGWEYAPQNQKPAKPQPEPSLFWSNSGLVQR